MIRGCGAGRKEPVAGRASRGGASPQPVRLDDGIYGIGVNLLRTGSKSAARHVSDRAEIQATLSVDAYLTLFATASYFRAGRFLHETPRRGRGVRLRVGRLQVLGSPAIGP